MKKTVLLTLCVFVAINMYGQDKKHVLIYTKNGKGFVHKNIPNSIKALKEICKTENIETEASEDPMLFNDENLKKYDAIIFSNANNKVFDTDAQKKAFQNYIKNGGGYVGIHSANAVERDWPWYWALVGGKFVRHAPHQEFDVVVTDKDHPSTEFLPEVWKVDDECYFSNHLNPNIDVLLAADLRTVDDKNKSEYPGDVFGDYFPICWTNNFEGAKQWYTSLGHDAETYDDPTFRKHLRGGILWVLGLED